MTTHLGSTTVEALRVPKPAYDAPVFAEMVDLSHELSRAHTDVAHARLQALAARCYGLDEDEFAHVLSTFPLVAQVERRRALEEFHRDRVLG